MLFTPFPAGEMPEGVRRHDDGPPFGRIALELDPDTDPTSTGDVVYDHVTGEEFVITMGLPCGLGCRCSAEARWAYATR